MSKPLYQKFLLYICLIIGAIFVFLPILLAFSMSFMPSADYMTGNIIPKTWTLDNYFTAFARLPFAKYLFNSLVTSVIIVLGQLLLSSLAAYSFVFIEFKGRELLFYLFIGTMMVPFEASIVPNFQTIKNLGLLDSYMGLTIPFFASAFGTFFLRQTFKQIPKELKEASEISGIGHFRFYWSVVLPVAKTSLITLGIYFFLTSWSMYLWPLLSTTKDTVRTVQIGLKQLQTQETLNEWGVIMAGGIIVAAPTLILLFFSQKRLQNGLAKGALK